jgi:hypothetical protein
MADESAAKLTTHPYFKEQARERQTYSTLHTFRWECKCQNSRRMRSEAIFPPQKSVVARRNLQVVAFQDLIPIAVTVKWGRGDGGWVRLVMLTRL